MNKMINHLLFDIENKIHYFFLALIINYEIIKGLISLLLIIV
jgi:hypothetical protein